MRSDFSFNNTLNARIENKVEKFRIEKTERIQDLPRIHTVREYFVSTVPGT